MLWIGQNFWFPPPGSREERGRANLCAIGSVIGDGELKQVTKCRPNRDVSLARHGAKCGICAHPQREEIEQAFVDWTSPTRIARAYKVSRDSVYRHAWAIGLLPKRQKNVRSALEKIIERAGEVKVNAAAVVSAVQAYAKINAQGQCRPHPKPAFPSKLPETSKASAHAPRLFLSAKGRCPSA